MDNLPFDKYFETINKTGTIRRCGLVKECRGLVVESQGPQASIGEICNINIGERDSILAEVVGFRDKNILLMPLGDLEGIAPGVKVSSTGSAYRVNVSPSMLGRILDGFGKPIDGKGSLTVSTSMPLSGEKINPLIRNRIKEPLWTRIRAIDGLLTIGKGQRIGIFAGSGVGKSVLMGMIARNVVADVNVIALIGERGREVREFIENDLGEEGLARSVVVAVTSDMPAILRIQGTKVAVTIAEFFRSQGLDVVLMMDSITRLAMAQREVGLSAGEPASTKGYTPSVFALMPKILERAGTSGKGTITGIYTVLVEGDDVNEPVSDTVRSIIDGHIVLTRKLANRGHFPAIDILQSISRLQKEVVDETKRKIVSDLLGMYADYADAEDMINIGAYAKGSSQRIDRAISKIEGINAFLRQGIGEFTDSDETFRLLAKTTGASQ